MDTLMLPCQILVSGKNEIHEERIHIRHAHHVGRVLISRKKHADLFGDVLLIVVLFPLVAESEAALAAIHPWWANT